MAGRAVLLAALAAVALASQSAADPPQWGPPVVVAQLSNANGRVYNYSTVADFNGDGHEDLLLTSSAFFTQQTFPVVVLLGDGHGHFSDGTQSVFDGNIPLVQNPRQLVVADFNADGRPDVFIADTGQDSDPFPGYQNTLILSAPGGKLVDATANLPQVADFTHSAAAGDVNGDGAIDIYVGNVFGRDRVPPRILLGDGTGHFTIGQGLLPAAETDLANYQYTGSLLSDMNGDGKVDLVLTSTDTVLGSNDPNSPSVVLLNDGTGHFSELPGAMPPKAFGADAVALGPATLDVNADGHPDLLVSITKHDPYYVGRWIQVLIGNGDGSFRDETATRLPQTDNSDSWAPFFNIRDLNGDGRPDFGATAYRGTSPIYLLNAAGAFDPGPSMNLPSENYYYWNFIDAEGDGANDILLVETTRGIVSLLPDIVRNPPVSTPAGPPPQHDTTAPSVVSLRLSPATFRGARSGPSIARTAVGTSVRYVDSEAGTTTFTVERAVQGVRRGKSCRPARKRERGRRCVRHVPLPGSFTHADTSGPNRLHFSGRLAGRTLAPGRYWLRVRPRDIAGNQGAAVTARFRVVAR